ncbi:MAG: hypothetical protein H6727_09505 [Myxococcales bacterium]|nr:hypothetical protein [Myxococcales bacterium]
MRLARIGMFAFVIASLMMAACGPPPPPTAPTGLKTNIDQNIEGRIVLSWEPHTDETVTLYRLYRDTKEDGPFTEKVFEGSDLQYTDTNVLLGGKYEVPFYYKLTAVRKVPGQTEQESEKSNAINATTKNITAPKPPTGLTIRAENLAGETPRITIVWEPNSELDIKGYYVFRKEGSDQAFTGPERDPNNAISRLVEQKAQGPIFFQDTAAEVGKFYTYTVVAVDVEDLASQNPTSIRVSDVLLEQIELLSPDSNATVSASALSFEWKAVSGAAAYVVVVRNTTGNEVWRSAVTKETKVTYGGSALDPTRKYTWSAFAFSKTPSDNKADANSSSENRDFRVN